jgi:UDP-N-acetylmuramoyl-L-alanyl-D-glutamate--2,6-diaminopimelate ligase
VRPSVVPPVPVAEELGPVLGLPASLLPPGLEVRGITHDSRAARRGDLYVGVPGGRHHGADFAGQAAAAGAVAMVSDRPCAALPTIVVGDPRAVLGPLSARVYGDPSQALQVIGVTGTNGKTTTAFFIEAGLQGGGRRAGLMGTIGAHVDGRRYPSDHTTPEAPDLQAMLAVMREQRVDGVAIEVSSHGLALGRVDGTRFAAGIFTNLTHDHLDFHGDMRHYLDVKAELFDPDRCAVAVVNVDDPHGARLAQRAAIPAITFSSRGRPATWQATAVRADGWSMACEVSGPGVRRPVRIGLPGHFNVDNALGAVAALHAVGVDPEAALAGMETLTGVPGRMQRVRRGQPFEAVVDYAHNPDALERVLSALGAMTPGRLTVVLGAPGDRDRAKRPAMGRIAARLADVVVVTDDDPWSEDPAPIREAVLQGARSHPGASVMCVPDREQAIATAVRGARPGDTVLVAGRGHEQAQVYRDRSVAFDDVAVLTDQVEAALRAQRPIGRHGNTSAARMAVRAQYRDER